MTKNPAKASAQSPAKPTVVERAYNRAFKRQQKVLDKKIEKQAKKQAIAEREKQELAKAFEKPKRRRSRPGFLLFVMLVTIGLSGAGGYLYRESEIINRDDQISILQSELTTVDAAKIQLEAEKKKEEARFALVETNDFSIKLLAEWSAQASEFPNDQYVYGDADSTLRINIDSPRSTNSVFIPTIDYVWFMSADNANEITLTSQSRHCQRFDTASNDSTDPFSVHQSLQVICDTDDEVTKIVVVATPENFGTTSANVYFEFETTTPQLIDFADIERVIESFSPTN